MFGKHFRRRPPWADEERWDAELEDRLRAARRDFPPHRFGPFRGRHFDRRPFPWDSADERGFAPRREHFERHGGRGGPFGGGPFGDDPFDEDGGGRRRHRRGDIKYVLLELLAEQPRHGYELIKELESRYAGFYRPSPGSVYPTLQMLEEEGHLTSELVDGKRVYTVTDSGRQLLQERAAEPGGGRDDLRRWAFRRGVRPELNDLRESAMALTTTVMQLARHGTPEQLRSAIERLDAVRRELYGILAEQGSERPGGEE